jgi:hypothetical protein
VGEGKGSKFTAGWFDLLVVVRLLCLVGLC